MARTWHDVDVLLEDTLAVGVTQLSTGDEVQQVACIQIDQGAAILMTKPQVLALVLALLETTDALDEALSTSGGASDE